MGNGQGLQRRRAVAKDAEDTSLCWSSPGGSVQALTWSAGHGVDQGSPPLPSVDPGAENHSHHVEHIQA